MTISTNRDSDRFMLRLPDGMRDRIKEEAEKNNRSMNAEIIARLEQSFDVITLETIDIRYRDKFIDLIEKQRAAMEKQSELLNTIIGKMSPDELKEVASRLPSDTPTKTEK